MRFQWGDPKANLVLIYSVFNSEVATTENLMGTFNGIFLGFIGLLICLCSPFHPLPLPTNYKTQFYF